jgi:hypothetical protein
MSTAAAQGRHRIYARREKRVVDHRRTEREEVHPRQTQHFRISYDASLGLLGASLAQAILNTCEDDYASLQTSFSGVIPAHLPFHIHLTPGSDGASHASCGDTHLFIGANSAPVSNPEFIQSLVVAEEDEVFEANFGQGQWDCGASNGEGLSRVLANDRYPGAEPLDFVSSAFWLDNGRPDFVNSTDPTDTNYLSIGCSVLFLNWLHTQLGYSWQEIIQAGAPTLAETYTNLTGQADGWRQFKTLMDTAFPGTPSGLITDNPFPLY